MDKETFLERIKEIGTIENDVDRRTKLTELTDDITAIFDSNTTLTEENNKYKEDNEKLRSANMQLFLRVGAEKTPEEIKQDNIGKQEEEKEKRKFEDLFDDKGNIK